LEHVGSQEFDVVHHFFGGYNATQMNQVQNNLPHPSTSRCPKDDPRMRCAIFGQCDEVTVAGHQDTALCASKRQLIRVRSAVEPLLDGRRDIDPPQPQAGCNGVVNVLVEVVFDLHPSPLAINRPRHGCGPGTPGRPPLSAEMPPRHRRGCAGR
jgi:hypothetical protein